MTLARRMFLASVVLALVVGAVFGALILAISEQSDATERETRSRKITAEVLRLEKLVVDMETGTRGLIITGGNMIFFEPYPQAKRQLPTHLSQLKELVADDPAQRKRANLLDQRIREYAVGVVDSGLPGPKGNREFFVHLVNHPAEANPDDIDRWIADAVGDRTEP